MGIKSYQNGKDGEKIIVTALKEHGYWVHSVQRRPNGSQPVDVIGLKKNKNILLDGKYVNINKKDYFAFSDVQPNQVASMNYAKAFAGIETIGFAIVLESESNEPRFLSFDAYMEAKGNGKEGVHCLLLPTLESIL